MCKVPVQGPSTSGEPARIAALESAFSQMAANVAEIMTLLRGPSCTSSSSTLPPEQGQRLTRILRSR
ncbi:hypothetical protein CDL15_Pgr022271 [Punica granatum]|uniref:Uncharacterized protein n=1 Tax=Punica granatum TaxID=22663 RepID=A0A218WNR1_PUNGR|nr:hypothetical protein CDL15_Pgr022271 [Punica granatum]